MSWATSLFGRDRALSLAALVGLGALASVGTSSGPDPSLVLLTLDTTRADSLGCYGAARASTPNLDALAARGTRYARALTAAPLTLPAHCSLMTGLDPPFHGVHDNGTETLPPSLPTLATVLASRGYATAAFVSSRVMDRRFGLAHGFATYDDRMAAEQQGQHGYPERNAEAVTSSASAWLSRLDARRPFFVWVHYYDPHFPYTPPGDWNGASAARRYAGEVEYMDREIGRLLRALPRGNQTLIAVVGDHGEMLDEHGERDHGMLLYRASLEVPLILAGPGVPAGAVVGETVGIRALAATLLDLLGRGDPRRFGAPLPGLSLSAGAAASDRPVYSETWLPATVYGWSPLRAVSDGRWRFVLGPRPELYDFVADPGETRNRLAERAADGERLRNVLADIERRSAGRAAPRANPSPEVVQALRNLGYLGGSSPPRAGGLDPKEGMATLLPMYDRANQALTEGRPGEAVSMMEDLVRRSPGNVPFLSRLADAQVAKGQFEMAVATMKEAIALNPRLDFLHLSLANTYKAMGRFSDARAEYEAALALNPRMSQAWLALGELAKRGGRHEEERRLLKRAVTVGTSSAAILTRLAQIETAAGGLAAAESHGAEATSLLPKFAAGWWTWGEVAEKRGRRPEAIARYEKAVSLGFADARAFLRLGRLLLTEGRKDAARRILAQAASLGGDSPSGLEARRLLADPSVRP